MQLIKYFFVVVGTVAAVTLASLLWPKFSNRPRPEPLTKVREMVVETPLGREVASLLGVADESGVGSVDLTTTAASLAGSVASTVSQKAQETVVSGIVTQMLRQYETLPQPQKEKVQEAVCQSE